MIPSLNYPPKGGSYMTTFAITEDSEIIDEHNDSEAENNEVSSEEIEEVTDPFEVLIDSIREFVNLDDSVYINGSTIRQFINKLYDSLGRYRFKTIQKIESSHSFDTINNFDNQFLKSIIDEKIIFGTKPINLPSLQFTKSSILNIYPLMNITVSPDGIFTNTRVLNTYEREIGLKAVDEHSSKLNTVFTVSNRNFVLAGITVKGVLVFIEPMIKYILSSYDMYTLGKLIEKIFDYVEKIYESYIYSINDLSDSFEKNCDLLRIDLISNMIVRIQNNIDSYAFQRKARSNDIYILEIIQNALELILNENDSSCHDQLRYNMMNRSKIYRELIKDHMRFTETTKKKYIEIGVNIGSCIFNALSMAGYIYNIDDKQWEKDITIYPEFAIKGGETYRIPESIREKCYVKKFIYSPSTSDTTTFSIKCKEARHANISGDSRICIGDEMSTEYKELVRSRNADMEYAVRFSKFLRELEHTLLFMNFDSAFNGINTLFAKEDVDLINKEHVVDKNKIPEFKDIEDIELRRV